MKEYILITLGRDIDYGVYFTKAEKFSDALVNFYNHFGGRLETKYFNKLIKDEPSCVAVELFDQNSDSTIYYFGLTAECGAFVNKFKGDEYCIANSWEASHD